MSNDDDDSKRVDRIGPATPLPPVDEWPTITTCPRCGGGLDSSGNCLERCGLRRVDRTDKGKV